MSDMWVGTSPEPADLDHLIGKQVQIRWDDCCTSGTITGQLSNVLHKSISDGRWFEEIFELKNARIQADGINIKEFSE